MDSHNLTKLLEFCKVFRVNYSSTYLASSNSKGSSSTSGGTSLTCWGTGVLWYPTLKANIESERPELGPYKCMLTLTRVLGPCVAAKKKPVRGTGWKPWTWVTGRPKADNILLVRWSVSCTTFPHLPCNPQLHNKNVILIIIYSTSTN